MSNADAQVINMVNAPHEERARREKQKKAARRRRASIRQAMMELTIKLELCLLAMGLIVIAISHGAVAGWLGAVGIVVNLLSGAVEVGRHMERRALWSL